MKVKQGEGERRVVGLFSISENTLLRQPESNEFFISFVNI